MGRTDDGRRALLDRVLGPLAGRRFKSTVRCSAARLPASAAVWSLSRVRAYRQGCHGGLRAVWGKIVAVVALNPACASSLKIPVTVAANCGG